MTSPVLALFPFVTFVLLSYLISDVLRRVEILDINGIFNS